jgi:phosphoglycerol transferase MdoB-like AlkP superfamily enzyme
VICLANPGFLLGSLGFSVLDLGGWGAAMIWGITAAIVFPVQVIYSELAATGTGAEEQSIGSDGDRGRRSA